MIPMKSRRVDGTAYDKENYKIHSINGARQGRRAMVSRRRVRMWIRLGTHHTPTGEKVEGRAARAQWPRPSRLDPLN